MKKIITLLITCWINVILMAAPSIRIATDKTEDGARLVETDHFAGVDYGWTGIIEFSLTCLDVKIDGIIDKQSYSLCVFYYDQKTMMPTIKKGRILLLKFADDSTGEFTNWMNVGKYDYTRLSDGFKVIKTSYVLTEQDIKNIITQKVKKIRIETDGENLDVAIKGNKFSKSLEMAYNLLRTHIETTKNDKYSNF